MLNQYHLGKEHAMNYKIMVASESERLRTLYTKTKFLEQHERHYFNKLKDTKRLEDRVYGSLHKAMVNSMQSQKTRLEMVLCLPFKV